MLKKYIIVIVSFSLIGFLWIEYKSFNLLGECSYEYLKKLPNPGNTYEAVHSIENCGATTDFLTLVRLKNIENNRGEYILILNSYHNDEIKLSWKKDEKLKIDFSGDLKYISSFKQKFEEITIELYKDDKLVSAEELEEATILREKEDTEFREGAGQSTIK